MKVIFHGRLAQLYGREHVMQTNVPADALEGLSRQLPDFPRDLAVDVIGFRSEDALRAPTGDKEIHVVPAMFGGGGVAKIIIGAILVIIGVVLLATGGSPWAIPLIMTGATMMLSGIAELMMKAPTADKSSDPPPSKYLGINRNTVATGTPIPLAWGRVKIAGHWLSLQSDSNELVMTSFPASTS